MSCVTHHFACDCREAMFSDAIADLLDELADQGIDTVDHPARDLVISEIGFAVSWTCHVCGDERPDGRISVHTKPLPGIEHATQNIRYCNDRPECVAGAPLFNFVEAP